MSREHKGTMNVNHIYHVYVERSAFPCDMPNLAYVY